ncbi:helix-turn-helix domain-containing protein [Pseudofrankia sp. BMG5.36]|uniref:helix-turn-helix domain-containing protein n=1 Tax=Pseudofrankia sp. BMG5.36 TaxID=1834512 RepID=UPI0008DAAD5B|nr:helix-turn-helix domain-containing protein [Pseudofrankia sp. BMG5.36]OHV75226.1 transcriptional regulator [Pseudofrankia sp. BMG5.36]
MADANLALARRLRALRRAAEGGLRQAHVAAALDVSVATVSSDENNARGIPLARLQLYAVFYAAPRADERTAAPRVAAEDELTAEERAARDVLLAELTALLRTAAASARELTVAVLPTEAPRRTWRFDDGAPVRIVCGQLPKGVRPPLASPDNVNYTELLSYADLDALMELWGHLRAENPAVEDVRFITSEDVAPDDMSGHLVLLGGLGWNQAADWNRRQAEFPVTQIEVPEYQEGEIFVIDRDGTEEKVVPTISSDPRLGLREDIGLLIRTPNPYNRARTLTICNGVYSRGVFGSVRCLTDRNLRERNERYIFERFGDAEEFGILMRIRVLKGKSFTPDLHDPDVIIFEWPERT